MLTRAKRLVHEVTATKLSISDCITNINTIAAKADEIVLGNTNKTLAPQHAFDSEIEMYSSIANTYQNPNENIINSILAILHIAFSFMLGVALMIYSLPMLVGYFTGSSFSHLSSPPIWALSIIVVLVFIYASLQINYFQKYIQVIKDGEWVPSFNKAKKPMVVLLALSIVAYQGYFSGWFSGSSPTISFRPTLFETEPSDEVIDAFAENDYDHVQAFWNNAHAISTQPVLPLRNQASGDDVVDLQQRLNAIGEYYFVIPRLEEDGSFGPMTESTVTAFQRLAGLPSSGIVDENTWEMIIAFQTSLLHADLVTTSRLNLRDNPGLNSSVLQTVPEGMVVRLISVYNDEWYEVAFLWHVGFMSADFLRQVF